MYMHANIKKKAAKVDGRTRKKVADTLIARWKEVLLDILGQCLSERK